jgi:hypothetical protein
VPIPATAEDCRRRLRLRLADIAASVVSSQARRAGASDAPTAKTMWRLFKVNMWTSGALRMTLPTRTSVAS